MTRRHFFIHIATPVASSKAMAATSSTQDLQDDEDEDIDESQHLQIESGNVGRPRSQGGMLGFLQRRQRTHPSGSRRGARGGSALDVVISSVGAETLLGRCFGMLKGRVLESSTEHEDEPLLFALTWAQPQRYGISPSPRNGHTMVVIGIHLYVFGGGDETVSFNDVRPPPAAAPRPPRHGRLDGRHAAAAVPQLPCHS